MVEILPPLQWAQRHFDQAQLGDRRRTQRVIRYATAAAASPSQSIPQQCNGAWKDTKGAYRLFDNPQVNFDQLQEPHRRLTLQTAAQREVVLWISDTTTLSFNHHPDTGGLGPTSNGGAGMLLHSTMAVDVSGGIDQSPFVLGLGHQQLWIRPKKGKKKIPESIKWQTGVCAIGKPPGKSQWIHVADSESDCWEAIESCRKQGSGFAIRACQNRKVSAGPGVVEAAEEPTTLLFDLLNQQPALGNKKLWVRGRPNRRARWAQLAVNAMAVTLLAPKNWSEKEHRKDQPRPQPIQCWALRVYEINTPAAEDPIEWFILTDEPTEDAKAALKVVFWYSCRWLIEEYHKCLKSGCQIESRQLEHADRLQSLLGISAVVAVRLLQLKHQAKVNPQAKATSVVPKNYVQTLGAYLKRDWEKLTTREFWRETARMGGFLGRKGDGDPGWLTLWRGWQQLEILTAGFELGKQR